MIEVIREDVERAFEQPDVYSGIASLLRDWAEQDEAQLSTEVRQFRTKIVTAITDSVVPPTLDRSVEPMVTVAYPGEQNVDVEARLTQILSAHPTLGRHISQAAPTFVPRSAGDALVVSVCLVGQGVLDVPNGAEALGAWLQSAFKPDPTDRLAWRQRQGYRDPIDFIDSQGRGELLQRMLAAAWNGELVSEPLEPGGRTQGTRAALVLRFGATDAPALRIDLGDMPFAHQLAPLIDAYLREIAHQYAVNAEPIAEILRELARVVPEGFVERKPQSLGDLTARSLFFEFVPELHPSGAGAAEREMFHRIIRELDATPNAGSQKRRRQLEEYANFWDEDVPTALRLSFGTLGFGSFEELLQDARQQFERDGTKANARDGIKIG
jgi:hypothetical protein